MTTLPIIRQYSGAIPDKATMDKDTFANSVHYYLRYFNDNFVPDTQNFTDKMNTLTTELNDFIDTANDLIENVDNIKNETLQIKEDTSAIKDEVAGYKIDVQNYLNETISYKDLAKKYANADEGVEVESGFYSAKHYMIKTQKIMDGAVAELPEGTIDDEAIGTNVTWSSQKIDDEIKKYAGASNHIDGGDASTSPDAYIDGGNASSTN